MRNLFDQYSQPENRLTHALMSCLAEDGALCREFIHWTTGRRLTGLKLEVLEQSLPGESVDTAEEEAERRGLPDGAITDGESFALIVESKIAAPVSADQLRRHIRTVERRGIRNVVLLLLSVDGPTRCLPRRMIARSWAEVYKWLWRRSRGAKGSSWARRCMEYFEVAEARGVAEEYLREGTLTVFSGIPFGPDAPYSYVQAKRLLGLLRSEVCRDKRLEKQLAADLRGDGRSAITGRDGSAVWDFIPLRVARKAEVFTQHPHLTLGLHTSYVEARVTIPNGIRSRLRTKMLGSDVETFRKTIEDTTHGLLRTLRRYPGATPDVVVVQRHYLSQRSAGTIDCLLQFDPRTVLSIGNRRRGPVKPQPQWLEAAFEALASRRSNIQFQIGARFPYRGCRIVRTPGIARAIADVWLACKPVLASASE